MKLHKLFLISLLILSACSSKIKPGSNEPAPSLEQIKALAGYWESTTKGEGGKKEAIIYKPTSGGTAVQEVLFPGTSHEMISMYHQDKGELVMTHYCMLGNQPRLEAQSAGPNKIVFRHKGGSNMHSHNEAHMHELVVTFVDKDHIRQEWSGTNPDGKAETKVIDLVRKRV